MRRHIFYLCQPVTSFNQSCLDKWISKRSVTTIDSQISPREKYCATTVIDNRVNGKPTKDLTFQGSGADWLCQSQEQRIFFWK